jgi:hypothetical protein
MTETLDAHAANQLDQRVRTLEAEVAQYRQRMEIIATMLYEEAVRRDWCSDYDAFVDNVNGVLGADVLHKCARDFTVSFSGTMTINANSEDAATEECSTQLARFEGRCDWSMGFEISDVEFGG